MANSYFKFKHFIIQQDRCAMKVGTDGVLLGAWVRAEQAQNILDIGTGTGLIALMLAQKSNAHIDAVEIDKSSYEQANENFSESRWSDKISSHLCSIQDFAKKSDRKYDLIITNPPYFEKSTKAKGESRTNARHNDLLPYSDLLIAVNNLLTDNGSFYIILPHNIHKVFIEKAQIYGLIPHKVLDILPNTLLPPKRTLLQFKRTSISKYLHDTLTIETEKRHRYTKNYTELTKDYYICN